MASLIRAMQPADLQAAAAIEATAADAWSLQGLREELDNQLAGGPARLFVILEEDQPAGLAAFQLAAGEATLNTVTVDPARRGRGLGAALVRTALAELRRQGAKFCFLEVREHNAPAIALYTRLGFCTAGKRRGFYQNPPEDALVMNLALDSAKL